MSTPTAINEEYDIVIAGGGTAACVVAGRLAVADANLRILLLEAGPTTYDNPAHTLPLNIMCHLAPGSRTTRAHISQPSAALGGRTTIVPCGQCLGGGGSINFMMYTRPSASDFDDWETVYQNPGWGSKDLIPLLKKIETYQVPGGGPTHGTDGPLAVSPGGYFTDLGKQFLQVARILDPDRAQKPDDTDSNDLETINVYTVGVFRRWINAKTGTRSDVPHNMIYQLKDTRPNLHFLTGVHVKHVTFDDENRATGVAYALNPLLHPEGPGDTRTVRGTKLVLVSAGAFGSPGILERSGIGTKDVLDSVGVRQRVDLPGVGENYQDHSVLFIQYFAADEAQSLAAIFRNEEGAIDTAAAEFGMTRKDVSMHNAVDAGIKWRPKPSEVAELGPEFQEYWDSYFANAPDKPVLWMGISSSFVGDPTGAPPRKYYTLGFYNQYPLARGHVHIMHADDVSAPTDFVPGFFESQAEVRPLTWGYKFLREIARRMPHFRGEPPMLHPKFAPSGPASIIAHAEGPVPFDAPRIVYSEDDERALEEFARAQVGTCWHSLGTCAMKPCEQGGVVDARLNVYGVHGLKVADLSVPPGNVSANTYGTALVIGEKAAVIIAEDLGIKGVV
ncbi:alcohol oxidase-like protein [Lactarius akahatsu]|uniref:Alcohol oxidase-like protein n=1 Tax=Lactarius akahatsu TaxID=416441 RepID=A0AAD4Q781_9AGAM|nr:alcohol oxidase-like protein [Lactarius akahatsu]